MNNLLQSTYRVANQSERAGVTPQAVRRSLQEVRDTLDQEVSVFEVGKQKVHFVLGTDGDRTWEDATAVSLLHNRHLGSRGSWVKVTCDKHGAAKLLASNTNTGRKLEAAAAAVTSCPQSLSAL